MPTADKKRRKLDKKVGQPPSQSRQTEVGDMVRTSRPHPFPPLSPSFPSALREIQAV